MSIDRHFVAGLVAAVLVGVLVPERPGSDRARLQPEEVAGIVKVLTNDRDARTRGRLDAPIHLIELLDLECEACREVHRAIGQLLDHLVDSGRVLYSVYDHPLPLHEGAVQAALVVRCAAHTDPSLGWVVQTAILEQRSQWSTGPDVQEQLLQISVDVGLDRSRIERCLEGAANDADHLRSRAEELRAVGVTYSPFFIANAQHVLPVELADRLRDFSAIPREALPALDP